MAHERFISIQHNIQRTEQTWLFSRYGLKVALLPLESPSSSRCRLPRLNCMMVLFVQCCEISNGLVTSRMVAFVVLLLDHVLKQPVMAFDSLISHILVGGVSDLSVTSVLLPRAANSPKVIVPDSWKIMSFGMHFYCMLMFWYGDEVFSLLCPWKKASRLTCLVAWTACISRSTCPTDFWFIYSASLQSCGIKTDTSTIPLDMHRQQMGDMLCHRIDQDFVFSHPARVRRAHSNHESMG
jgi:hypothetical protein